MSALTWSVPLNTVPRETSQTQRLQVAWLRLCEASEADKVTDTHWRLAAAGETGVCVVCVSGDHCRGDGAVRVCVCMCVKMLWILGM